MARSTLKALAVLSGVAGPVFMFQQGCTIDPDITFRALLQFASELAIFLLDNAAVGLR